MSEQFELMYVVVNCGQGSKILHKAKEFGVTGGTIFIASGTVNNSFLNFLSLYDERKEVVLMAASQTIAQRTLNGLNQHFKFHKPHHGIAFSTALMRVVGSKSCETLRQMEEKQVMYQVIFTIVERGNAQEVIEAASHAGSKGGTIINARGSGVHETARFFNMEIEPEKEIVMIIAKKDVVDAIVEQISKKLAIEKPGNGIIFVQDVSVVHGIYELNSVD